MQLAMLFSLFFACIGAAAADAIAIAKDSSPTQTKMRVAALNALMDANKADLAGCLEHNPKSVKEIEQFFDLTPVNLNADGITDYLVEGQNCISFLGAHSRQFWIVVSKKDDGSVRYSIMLTASPNIELPPEFRLPSRNG